MDATTEKAISVIMTGGAPWGFRLQGGEGTPLQVSKIRKRSKAHTSGLVEGDVVIEINGENVETKSHTTAMELVDGAQKDLTLEIVRGRRPLPPLPSDKVDVPVVAAAPLAPSEQVVVNESQSVDVVISLEESKPVERVLTIETPETKTIDIKVEKEQTEVKSSSTPLPGGGNVDVVVETKTILTSSVPDGESTDVSIQKKTIITTTSTTSSTTSSIKESTVSHQQMGTMELAPTPTLNHVPTSIEVNRSFTQTSSIMPQKGPLPQTRGTALIDDAISKLDSFPKVSDMQYTALEDNNAQFMQDQFPTETVTAELKEDYKENIAPIKSQSYQEVQVNKSPKSFHVKKFTTTSSSTSTSNNKLYQPSIGAWPSGDTGDRIPSIIDIQKKKFQQEQDRQQRQQQLKRPSQQQQQPSPLSATTANQQWTPPQQWTPNQQWAPSGPQIPPPTHPKPTHPKPLPLTVEHSDHKKMHVFGPPVIISLDSPKGVSSDDDSSIIRQGKKLYSDSAFYNDPNEKYPTIEEQMKLCQTIAQSLTAAANKKARGARMFAKRKNRASRWVHDGYERGDSFSSDGDVANTEDLESELWPDEGGNKPLFHFRIPNVSRQVSSPDDIQKMALSQNEFEKLRLEKQKCEHKGVSPVTCFNLVADLQSHKGRGAKIFDRRKQTSENWVVDESNVKSPPIRSPVSMGPNKLSEMLKQPPKPQMSPWDAAMGSPYGAVDAAFDHLSEYEKMKRRNQGISMQPVAPMAPMPHGKHTSLAAGYQTPLLQGQNFNRMAKGWTMHMDDSMSGFAPSPVSSGRASPSFRQEEPPPVQPKPKAKPQFRDYNPKPKAWTGVEDMSVGSTHSLQRETHFNNYQAANPPQQYGSLPTQFRQHHGGGDVGRSTPPQGYRQSNQQNRSSFHQDYSSQHQQFQDHRQQQPMAMPGTDL